MVSLKENNISIVGTFKNMLDITSKKIIKIKFDYYVYHYTSESVVDQILLYGFKTGFELQKAEKRSAIFFSDKEVNTEMFSRNKEGELYEGEKPAFINLNIKNLTLLNLNYKDNEGQYDNHKKYKYFVVKGKIEDIPYNIDGTISFTPDGLIYEVALKKEIANKLLTNKD